MDEPHAQSYLWFVEAVCHRPGMYTATGTLEEVFCFLNGFYSGMSSHTLDQRAMACADREWHEFLAFASRANSGWFALYTSLRQAYTEDAAAFAQLLASYQEYRLLLDSRQDRATPTSAPEA